MRLRSLLIVFLVNISITCLAGSEIEDAYSNVIDMVVDANGDGNYNTVQAAINAVPSNSSKRTVIFVRNGSYYEKVRISSSKKNVVMIGEDVDSTIIYFDDYAQSTTGDDVSFVVAGDNFLAMNLTIANSYDLKQSQAIALETDGDKQVFLHCRLTGWQDTFYSKTKKRNYFKDCFIEGCVDYIFGPAIAVFDSCQLHNVREDGGYITAASTDSENKYGYVFRHCNVTGAVGVKNVDLGRPWREYAKTVFMQCYLHDIIKPRGWNDWGKTEAIYTTIFYGEYANEGPGYKPDYRVDWSHILTDEQAQEYTLENIFLASSCGSVSDNWLPEVDKDSLYQILKDITIPFMDSTNYNSRVAQVKFQGDKTLEFDPAVFSYNIELETGTTEVPELIVVAEDPNANIEIEHPESVPGVTTVTVTAYDRSSTSVYDIYYSVDGAYDNALLDSVYIKNIKVEDFDPNKFEYDFVLPEGSSKYFAVKPFLAVEDASYRYQKVTSLPGVATVTVTSYSGNVTNVYTFNITVSTGIEDNLLPLDMSIKYINSSVLCDVKSEENTPLTIELYDINGQKVWHQTENLIAGNNKISIPALLEPGVYVYKAYTYKFGTEGKFIAN